MNKFMYCAELKTGEIRFGIIEADSGDDCRRRLRLLRELSNKLDFVGVRKGETHAMIGGKSFENVDPPPLNPINTPSPSFLERLNNAT